MDIPEENTPPPDSAAILSLPAYFRSGWAFLIPYLFAYLLSALFRWPVSDGLFSLLHVYWLLHALHLILAGMALRSCLHRRAARSGSFSFFAHGLGPVLPWVLLGLLFFIPGSYLEFPSDNWVHYTRLLDFTRHSTLTEIPTWTKSSYFFGYSLFGNIADVPSRLSGLNLWYGACGLLLCWQYYLLARSVNLPTPAAFVFVLLQTLLLGNSAFNFYRYYGLSSALFAQLGALALIRVALETSRCPLTASKVRNALLTGGLLTLLIVFNHVQGVAIAGIGLLGVFLRYLILEKRTRLLVATILGLATANLVAYSWIAHSGDSALSGWLTPWRGFDFFSPASAAHVRAMAVLGWLGTLNLVAGLILLRRNRLEGWLTVTPLLILM